MKYFVWDDAKNAKLKADRGIGFEEVAFHIERGGLLDLLSTLARSPTMKIDADEKKLLESVDRRRVEIRRWP